MTLDNNNSKSAGDSSEQTDAEKLIVAQFAADAGLILTPQAISLSNGVSPNIDGVSEDPLVLCEAWAHQGRPRGAQLNKPIADALKLLYVERALGKGQARKVLLFSDESAAAPFVGSSWRAKALQSFGIEVKVVPIPDDVRSEVNRAQKRQFR